MEVIENFAQFLKEGEKRDQILLYMGQVSIFAGLSQPKLLALAEQCEARHYDAKEVLFVQDSPGNDLHVVLEGKVHLIRKQKDGSAKVIATREQGSSFGEVGFITGAARNLTAVASQGGTLQLVLSRARFDELIKHDPEIGFAVFKDILDTVSRRMEWLPPFFRNYLLWGYRPPEAQEEESKTDEPAMAKPPLFGIAAGAAGLVGGIIFAQVLGALKPELQAAVQQVTVSAAIALGLAGAAAGGAVGNYYEKYEEDAKYSRQHAHACINCKFVIWDENSTKHDCFYRVEKMFQITFRPGRKFDTYTDCPSFDVALPDEKVKAQRRDTLGKD